MSKEFYGFDDDDFKIEGETHVKPWQPITWENRRPDHLAWRYVDDGIEVLAYNYSFGENLQAFYLERAPNLAAIGVQPKGEPQAEPTEHCPSCGYTKEDAQFNGDHRLCKNVGKAPWELQPKGGELCKD
jgi:hypothetical protein